MKKILTLCICIAYTLTSNAQTADKKWNIGVHGGLTQYNGDLGRSFYKTDATMYGFGGLSVSRYLGKLMDANLLLTKGTIGYHKDAVGFKSDFNAVSFNLRFNLTAPEYIIRPYVLAGVGVILFDNQINFDQDRIDYALPTAGAGINFRLSPEIMLNLQETFSFSNKDRRDGVEAGENDSYLSHMVGLTFNLGSIKDADKDGVSDKKDKCPDTPAGITVDKKGCPLDRDNDGVADYLDSCPDVLGTVALNGCPDKDNDGITDTEDRCPEQAGTKALKGCPDADNDGVADLDDKCPNTKAGSRVDASGCIMDSDNDGVMDDEDRCPETAGPIALKGCPDTDGDGVANVDDRCPEVKGTIANKGCPEITKQDAVRITYLGSKIFFENNSDKLKVASLSQLDELTKILYKYEGANLVIEGYTDSNGSDAFNLNLSQKRTESVRNYLIEKGINAARLTGIGKGESNPIASNKTSLGRAKNRRVELKTNY
ncbi:MAG: OmpA family protein [Flavobacterium sp.]|nr:OmpA family protein [Flavobacterium sp.]